MSGNLGNGGAGGKTGGVRGRGSGGLTNVFTATVRNTLSAGNTGNNGGADADGNFSSQGYNLIGKADGSTGFTVTGDKTGTVATQLDAKLAALANNGGSTDTIALLVGSPAIDAGNDATAPAVDQRGQPRIGVADIGAFEFNGTAPTPTPTPVPSTLANISTRLRVETGDNALIAGFIITGTQPKKIIVRGIGSSLAFADRLADPTLELRDAAGNLLDSNDNWIDSPDMQAIIATTIPPSNDLESAIVATLPANNSAYTAIVRGANNGTGIGVVEAYDLDRLADSELANISTRGFVQTGDNVLIAGTIVVGQDPQRVLIRAIGPSLPIAGRMENPTLELRDSNGGLLDANDNWIDSPNEQAIIDTTIPPTNDFESAIIQTLPANNASYTAIVRGVNDTTGIAVVEIYALP